MTASRTACEAHKISFTPLIIDREICPGTDLAELICTSHSDLINPGSVLIATHKAIAKAEGRLVRLKDIAPSPLALEFASRHDKDPQLVELVLSESQSIVRMTRGCIIAKTKHGIICANAGIDLSNIEGQNPEDKTACLLPEDPDMSAQKLSLSLQERLGFFVPVIISDSFGRPWREGIVNFAIGCYGMDPFTDYRGMPDSAGRILKVTRMASADALAAGAELACGKLLRAPFTIADGFKWIKNEESSAKDLIRSEERNFFP